MGCLPGINKPSFDDLKPGMVFLLPGDQEVIDAMANSGLEETDRPWEHPAVVTWKFEKDGEEYVKFRTCTTFDHRSVVEAKPEHQRALFLLAENKEDVIPHWGTSLGRMAPCSDTFGKRTYVNLSFNSVYTVKYTMLKLFKGKLPMQFDEEALDMIKRCEPC